MKIDNRVWIILTVVVIAALFAGGWFLGAQPQFDAMAASISKTAQANATNAGLEQELRDLAKAKEGLSDLQDEVALLQKAIPGGTDSSAFITALNNLAAAAGVTITAIGIDTGQPYTPPAGDAKPAAPLKPGEGGAPTPETNALIDGQNFVVVPISIDVLGPWQATLNFIKGLQSAERLVLVTGVDTQRDGEEDLFKVTVTGSIYVLRAPGNVSADASTDTDTPAVVETPTPAPTDTAVPSDPEPSVSPSPSSTGAAE
jgi:Tfp pilus assembly protein PilO